MLAAKQTGKDAKLEDYVVLDEDGNVLESYDESKGYVDSRSVRVIHSWVVDEPEQSHLETTAIYENGGKSVQRVVDSEEKGHWITTNYVTRDVVNDYKGPIDDSWPHDVEIDNTWYYGVYVPYSEEEIASQQQSQKQEQESLQISTQSVAAVSMMMRSMSPSLTDAQVAKVPLLFDKWAVGSTYSVGEVVSYNDSLYRCLQQSTAQEIYPPDQFVAGWKKVEKPVEGVMPWSQPLGATDYYMTGDEVLYEGQTWVSDVDVNVYVPGQYGWHVKEAS